MKKLLSLILTLIIAMSFIVGCSKNGDKVELNKDLQINFSVLSGTTGWGAVKLLDNASNKTSNLNYCTSIESNVKVVQDALVAGEVDIAALPTNKAAMISSKTNGAIKIIAVNTLGVMYMVASSNITINSIDDLSGKTVCIPEEPSYILKTILEANNVLDVNIETYNDHQALLGKVAVGEVDIAVLPEPLLSAACSQNNDLKVVLDLTKEWNNTYPESILMQGCIVARTDFIKEHSNEINEFLSEYKDSVNFVNNNPDDASLLIEKYLGAKAKMAQNAIPRCNLTFIAGEEMKNNLQKLYNILIKIDSSNIGNDVPNNDFYYIEK